LTRRAKQAHNGIIAKAVGIPLPGGSTWLRENSSSTSQNLNRRTAGA
jgi:hypothetical protein